MRRTHVRPCPLLACVAALLVSLASQAAPAGPAPRFILTDLGDAIPGAINNRGEVTGIFNDSYPQHAWLYSGGVIRDIEDNPRFTSMGRDINDRGEVLGRSGDGTTTPWLPGFLYGGNAGAGMRRFADPGGRITSVAALNNHGVVVGYAFPLGNISAVEMFHYDGRGFAFTRVDAGEGAYFVPEHMNDVGTIVGIRYFSDGQGGWRLRAAVYDSGVLRELPTFSGRSSYASAINERGWIVGGADLPHAGADEPPRRAFLYRDDQLIDLGTLGGSRSSAAALNERGDVVGVSYVQSGFSEASRAFLYTDGTMYDLNELIEPGSGWVLEGAGGINDAGQIIGAGHFGIGGGTRGFLLTPVPEPGGAVLVAALGAAAACRRPRPVNRTRSAVEPQPP